MNHDDDHDDDNSDDEHDDDHDNIINKMIMMMGWEHLVGTTSLVKGDS